MSLTDKSHCELFTNHRSEWKAVFLNVQWLAKLHCFVSHAAKTSNPIFHLITVTRPEGQIFPHKEFGVKSQTAWNIDFSFVTALVWNKIRNFPLAIDLFINAFIHTTPVFLYNNDYRLVFLRVLTSFFIFTGVHLCSPVFICVHLCSSVFICVHLCSPVFICVHLCGVLD